MNTSLRTEEKQQQVDVATEGEIIQEKAKEKEIAKKDPWEVILEKMEAMKEDNNKRDEANRIRDKEFKNLVQEIREDNKRWWRDYRKQNGIKEPDEENQSKNQQEEALTTEEVVENATGLVEDIIQDKEQANELEGNNASEKNENIGEEYIEGPVDSIEDTDRKDDKEIVKDSNAEVQDIKIEVSEEGENTVILPITEDHRESTTDDHVIYTTTARLQRKRRAEVATRSKKKIRLRVEYARKICKLVIEQLKVDRQRIKADETAIATQQVKNRRIKQSEEIVFTDREDHIGQKKGTLEYFIKRRRKQRIGKRYLCEYPEKWKVKKDKGRRKTKHRIKENAEGLFEKFLHKRGRGDEAKGIGI